MKRARSVFLPAAMVLLAVSAAGVSGQARPELSVEREDGSSTEVPVRLDRGYAVVPASVVADLGWVPVEDEGGLGLTGAGRIHVAMQVGSPFFEWDGEVLQMADAPYRAGGVTYVPLQFLTDFLPGRLPGLYDFVPESGTLRAGEISLLGADAGAGASPATPIDDPTRVVIIDAGHGGVDPGALGSDGIREKVVALGIASRLQARLLREPHLEVHMIRDDDSFVDLWERGQIATGLKGARPGVFISIHANSFPARREARGFETYFLSDARSDHERRVEAIENAPLSMSAETMDSDELEELDFILRDLKNYDHAHWSEELATLVQGRMAGFHPGPNRGVKQGVLAVLTNALMPSVLVEVGYLSNEAEARLLAGEDFQADAADAIAEAVLEFYLRYPPGSTAGGSSEGR